MELLIKASSPEELATKVLNLAKIMGCDPAQLPLPVPVSSTPEVAPSISAAPITKEEPGPDLPADEPEKPTKEEKPKGKGKGGKAAAKKQNETKQMGDEPAATINWSGETASTETKEETKEETKPKEVTKQMVADACQDVTTKKNLDAARKLLGKFNSASNEPCRRISELKPEDYAAFVEACEKEVKG